ncbi:MAG: RluA family pseudouridine synthase [Paludibacteraceae bacterium]|jgi:23S rRNA pseudouridine1911/1915/1917 synthase|nr:RluA family pseudouridine synthase [Paludibacteraceae bacterium]MED9996680.1 RluA family pseudouridine synthase [Paludibacteraceae bacterium]
MPEIKQFSVRVLNDAPLMEFLTERLKDYNRTKLKSLLMHRQLWLNGEVMLTRHDYPLKAGDRVDIRSAKTLIRAKKLEHSQIKVLFEDESIMVVYKNEGFLTVGTDREKLQTVYHVLNQYMKSFGHDKRIFVVHRLDRETSGLLVFAKSKEVQETLQSNWDTLMLERSYTAIVKGQMPESGGTIKAYLWEDKQLRMHASQTDNGGQYAETKYQVLATKGPYSMVQLWLKTGRKNQIRVHLQSVGCPIVGDKKYGGPASPIKRVCLHAGLLTFKHPVTGQNMHFEWPIPASFNKLVRVR